MCAVQESLRGERRNDVHEGFLFSLPTVALGMGTSVYGDCPWDDLKFTWTAAVGDPKWPQSINSLRVAQRLLSSKDVADSDQWVYQFYYTLANLNKPKWLCVSRALLYTHITTIQ